MNVSGKGKHLDGVEDTAPCAAKVEARGRVIEASLSIQSACLSGLTPHFVKS